MSTAGTRIKQARLRNKLSQRALAEQTDVSATAISKYERGLMKPGSDVLIQIAKAMDVDISFFLRPHRVGTIEPAYRKLKKLRKKSEKQLIERIRDWLERYLEAEDIVLPEPKAFSLPEGFPWRVMSEGDAEAASNALREAWDLGMDPIEDLTAILEDHGIRVGVIEADDDFDACTFQTEIDGQVPVIVTRRGLFGDRQRFNLAHELGHLLLEVSDDLDEESVCHRFAGALLAPGPGIRSAVGEHRRKLTGDELHVLKHKYGISMQALIFRLRELGVISEAMASKAHRRFRQEGWHRTEPGEQVEPEHPQRFHLLVLHALAEGLISERRARELYDGPITELDSDLEAVA